MSIPIHELEDMRKTLTAALNIVDSLSKKQASGGIPSLNDERSQIEVLTISQLMKRLRISKLSMYDILSEPGCPVYSLGGPKQRRVIWSEFVEWLKERGDVS